MNFRKSDYISLLNNGTDLDDDFKVMKPSDGSFYNCNSRCSLSISNKYLYLNTACFRHFNGHQYFQIAFSRKRGAVAVVKGDKNSKDTVKLDYMAGTRSGYNSLHDGRLLADLFMNCPMLKPKGHETYRVSTDLRNIKSNYIIFKINPKMVRVVSHHE